MQNQYCFACVCHSHTRQWIITKSSGLSVDALCDGNIVVDDDNDDDEFQQFTVGKIIQVQLCSYCALFHYLHSPSCLHCIHNAVHRGWKTTRCVHLSNAHKYRTAWCITNFLYHDCIWKKKTTQQYYHYYYYTVECVVHCKQARKHIARWFQCSYRAMPDFGLLLFLLAVLRSFLIFSIVSFHFISFLIDMSSDYSIFFVLPLLDHRVYHAFILQDWFILRTR